jgi:hypothetical protein
MTVVSLIEAALEFWGAMIALILSIISHGTLANDKNDRLLWYMLLPDIALLISVAFCVIYDGDTSLMGYYIQRIFHIVNVGASTLTLAMYCHYVANITVDRRGLLAIDVIAGGGLVGLLVNPVTHLYYYFDQMGTYVREPGLYILFSVECFMVIFMLIKLFRHKFMEDKRLRLNLIMIVMCVAGFFANTLTTSQGIYADCVTVAIIVLVITEINRIRTNKYQAQLNLANRELEMLMMEYTRLLGKEDQARKDESNKDKEDHT